MKKLPWKASEYVLLSPDDLKPTPPPTDAQKLRVAAALATLARDNAMTGKEPPINSEAIRAILVATPETWARDISHVAQVVAAYDPVDPKKRFEQIRLRSMS